jgi:D,D-heptose 1,7-bisphosphate phosphatase
MNKYKDWTLFLDRDGVINVRNFHGYITRVEDFKFIDGSLKAVVEFSKLFARVVVVTNQQCIGKGIITSEKLDEIHSYMTSEVKKNGGNIDAIYYAPNLASENSELRKPKAGMADLAKKDFPEIDFTKSIMVGDSISDLEFGKAKDMKTIFISIEKSDLANEVYVDLYNFYQSVIQ